MRKKHPIRRFFIFVLLAAIVAGLAALPMLTKSAANDENKASILSATPERRELKRSLISGAPLATAEPVSVSIPSGVKITEYLVSSGDTVTAGTPLARVDDVSVMTAVKAVQESLDSVSGSLQSVRSKITPGAITVDDEGSLCVNGSKIPEDSLASYAQFVTLTRQHREYEQLLLELFLLHQDGIVTAPCDGMVGALDEKLIWKLSSDGSWEFVWLSADTEEPQDPEDPENPEEPEDPEEPEEPETGFTCFLRAIIRINPDGTWVTRKSEQVFTISSILNPGSFDRTLSNTEEVIQPDSPVLDLSDGSWSVITPEAGDLLLYAEDSDGGCWILKIGTVDVPGEIPTDPTDPTQPTQPTRPGGGGGGSGISQEMIEQYLSTMGSRGRSGSSGSTQQGPSLYSTEKVTLCTVTPMETMQLTLAVDEMDIAALRVGMQADLTLEALPNRHFTGEIKEISQFGTNSGGSSKFAVLLELPCDKDMLPGMNVNVTVTLETLPDCLTIPVAALTGTGTKPQVFTAYDETTETLLNPVTPELGYSDGESVQILSGLDENTTIWYSYYDTVEISNAVESRNSLFG